MSEPKEIFPVRMNTTENVVDYRPLVEDVVAPDEDDVDPKAGADSAPESASSVASSLSSEPKPSTTSVPTLASRVKSQETKKQAESS